MGQRHDPAALIVVFSGVLSKLAAAARAHHRGRPREILSATNLAAMILPLGACSSSPSGCPSPCSGCWPGRRHHPGVHEPAALTGPGARRADGALRCAARGVPAPQPDELHLRAPRELTGALCSTLYRKFTPGWPACLPRTRGPTSTRSSSIISMRSIRRTVSCWCAADPPDRRTHLADECRARRQLAGTRDPGSVRSQAGRASEPARCALHETGGRSPVAQGLRPAHPVATFAGDGTSSAQSRRGRVSGAGRPGPRRSSSPDISVQRPGEPVLYLQLRMFYVQQGIEKLFESLPLTHGVRLRRAFPATRVLRTPRLLPRDRARPTIAVAARPRVAHVGLELERIANHVGDIGAICTDVAFVTAHMHALRLKEQ